MPAPMIKLSCPECGGQFRPADLMRHATIVVHRTCRTCKVRWQAVISPITTPQVKVAPGALVHKVDWTGEVVRKTTGAQQGITPRNTTVLYEGAYSYSMRDAHSFTEVWMQWGEWQIHVINY